jgi:hypothetical protein
MLVQWLVSSRRSWVPDELQSTDHQLPLCFQTLDCGFSPVVCVTAMLSMVTEPEGKAGRAMGAGSARATTAASDRMKRAAHLPVRSRRSWE